MFYNKRCTTIALVFCSCWAAAVDALGVSGILPRLGQGENLMISAIGTSETAMSPWLDQMGAWLNSRYPGQVALDNEAISGTSSWNGLQIQWPAALQHDPDAVFIEFAINDAALAHNISLEESKSNLQRMIDAIRTWAAGRNKAVDVVIQTTNNDPFSGVRPRLESYYQGYRDVARTNGLLLIDNYPNWSNLYSTDVAAWNRYIPDGIHPNALGVENVILPDIQRALLSRTPEPSTFTLITIAGAAISAAMLRNRRDQQQGREPRAAHDL